MEITKTDLFYNISEQQQAEMMHCFKTYTRTYKSGEVICFYDDNNIGVGIIESGSARVIHFLPNGTQTILEQLCSGDLFGQLFYHYACPENISLEATCDCVVRFIDYEHIIKRCSKACPHHSQLVNNILVIISDKTRSICEHLEVLSGRTIRDRLNNYFEILSSKSGSNTFKLPFTMTALADYLSVDRSAMSRELKKMKDEGLIQTNKGIVTINR